MGQFWLVVSYENPKCAETFEVQADGLPEAEAICEKFVSDNAAMLERLESVNVFMSKRACGCEVVQKTASSSLITTVT